MTKEKIVENINAVMAKENTMEIAGKGAGWVNLANLGKPLREAGINLLELGFERLRPFFESFPDMYEVCMDKNKSAMVAYVRPILKEELSDDPQQMQPTDGTNRRKRIVRAHSNGKGNSDIRNNRYVPLEDWAYLYDINSFLQKLASMAQKECWSFNNGLPAFPELPVLYSYLRYTFCRLQHQNKIAYSIEGDMAAFNTGLTDNRYEPIIALFKKNRPDATSEWKFLDFVIAGEDKGKIINNKFIGVIESATYTENPSELIYDISLGAPIVDFDHIVIERIDRLPDAFIIENSPRGFKAKKTDGMNKIERDIYYEQLRGALRNDHAAYRNIIYRVKDAIALALKRVHWNYKNAVPMFYPKENRMCLLLPLCLIDDRKEDVALVVKRTPANKYEGATILTLDLAYSDARVVARPNSEWLDAQLIPGSGESLL